MNGPVSFGSMSDGGPPRRLTRSVSGDARLPESRKKRHSVEDVWSSTRPSASRSREFIESEMEERGGRASVEEFLDPSLSSGHGDRPGRTVRRVTPGNRHCGHDFGSPHRRRLSPAEQRNLSETTRILQVRKDFLSKEIEARSQKISAQRRREVVTQPELPRHRLFVVSARLPFTVFINDESNEFTIEHDPFDMHIADLLETHHRTHAAAVDVILVGAPLLKRRDGSVCNCSDVQGDLDAFLRSQLKVVPVFLPPNRDRFAESVLFPLFHYSPPSVETGLGFYDWEGYVLINEMFRDAVIKEYCHDDMVWINDYPLMLLPKLLRTERTEIHVGFYIHCVFPSSEVYRILPQRAQLLRGVLSANIIGFHNFQYVRHFLTSCTRILGLECSANGIEACEEAGGTLTKVIAVPLGINLVPFDNMLMRVKDRERLLAENLKTHKVLVAIDRLEEKRGIPHKIMAYNKFLEKEPKWAEQCVFVQIVDFGLCDGDESENVDERYKLLQQIYQMVGEVNSHFGTIGHLPLHFLCKEFEKADLVSLLVQADVMIDTSLREVLSPSSHEFLYCQEEEKCGVLILSEFSGSAHSLRAAALTVNPWDTNAFADAIQEALEMGTHERIELHRYGRKYVKNSTLVHWAGNFLEELKTSVSECETERLQIPPPLQHDQAVAEFGRANRRVIILGFRGTLIPRAQKHFAQTQRLPTPLVAHLRALAEDPNTHLIIVSSYSGHFLEHALEGVRCWIIAEGGVCYREPDSDKWIGSEEQRVDEWLDPVKEIMEYFTARTPGSHIIETSSTVSWHYQTTQGDHAAIQSKDLLIHLWAGPLLSAPAEVIVGKDSVCVRPSGVGKASQLETVLKRICTDDSADQSSEGGLNEKEHQNPWLSGDTFVMCISDLLMRDEDVFVTVQKFFETDRAPPKSFTGRPIPDHEPSWSEEILLEQNSKSLSCVYGKLDAMCARTGVESSAGPFGFNKRLSGSLACGDVSLLSKNLGELPGLDEDQQFSSGSNFSAMPYTCTTSRKATRAMYHVSDTHEVSFLIAKFTRELRQARQANEKLHEVANVR